MIKKYNMSSACTLSNLTENKQTLTYKMADQNVTSSLCHPHVSTMTIWDDNDDGQAWKMPITVRYVNLYPDGADMLHLLCRNFLPKVRKKKRIGKNKKKKKVQFDEVLSAPKCHRELLIEVTLTSVNWCSTGGRCSPPGSSFYFYFLPAYKCSNLENVPMFCRQQQTWNLNTAGEDKKNIHYVAPKYLLRGCEFNPLP